MMVYPWSHDIYMTSIIREEDPLRCIKRVITCSYGQSRWISCRKISYFYRIVSRRGYEYNSA